MFHLLIKPFKMSSNSREMVCTICSETTIAKTLSCGHTFHVGCIDGWLNNNGTCPVCRRCFNISHTSSSNSSVTIECSICLEGILSTKILPCGDTFHEPCVNPLLREANHCPQCYMRFDMEEEIDMSLCTFCQEAVLDREETLPCGHTFHKPCVASWLEKENTCPECKIPLDPDKWICSDEASSSRSNNSDSICVICETVIEQNKVILSCGHKCHSTCTSSLENCPFCLLPSTFPEENTSNDIEIPNDGSCCFCTEMIVDSGVTLTCGHTFHDTCIAFCPEEEVVTCPQCFPQRDPIQSGTSPRSSSNHSTSCIFCLKRITDDEISLTCNHMFHKKCVAPWIREQKMCPVCLAPSEVPSSTFSTEPSSTIRTDNQVTCLFCSQVTISDQVTLACGHKFHKLCVIISWQDTDQKKCPECLLPCESLSDEENVGDIPESNSTSLTSSLHQAEVPTDMNTSLQPGCSNTQNDERADSLKSIPEKPNYPSSSVENINENMIEESSMPLELSPNTSKEEEDKDVLVNDVETSPNVLCEPSNSHEESQLLLESPNDEVNDCHEPLDESSFELITLPLTTDCSNGIQKKVTLSSEECSSNLNQDNMKSGKPIPTCSGQSSTLQTKAHRDSDSHVDEANTDAEKYVDKNCTVKHKPMHIDKNGQVDVAQAITDSYVEAADKYADNHVNKAHTTADSKVNEAQTTVDSQANEAQTTVDSQVNEVNITVDSHVNEDHTNAKSETCQICSQTIGNDEITLPCKHKYHKSCMTLLLQH